MADGASTTSFDARLWFVIPAYNEGAKVGDVVRTVTPFAKVVVVDDGSVDETGAHALGAGAHVLTMPINRGQGAALQTGIEYAVQEGAARIITFDADGQHQVDDALRMAARLDSDGLDVVLGSRFLGKTMNMSLARRLTLKAATKFTNLTTGLDLTDTHNGLRALSREAAQGIRLTQDRMAHASEILEIIAAKKLRFAEEPVTIVYTEYSMAKGQRLRNSINILEELLFERFLK